MFCQNLVEIHSKVSEKFTRESFKWLPVTMNFGLKTLLKNLNTPKMEF